MNCDQCGAKLALDQKYCVSCGQRSGSLPARVAGMLAAFDMPKPPVLAGVPSVAMAPPTSVVFPRLSAAIDGSIDRGEFPSPKICALAVMSLLAFGVVLGGIVGATGVGSPVYLLPPSIPAAAPVAPAAEPASTAPGAPIQALAEGPTAEQGATAPTQATSVPREIKHVWLIVLSGQGYSSTFGSAEPNAYLTRDLVPQGEVIENYFSVARSELANSIALISGQAPTEDTLENCPKYTPVTPGTVDPANGLVAGNGCVFPAGVKTLPEAVAGTGKIWRGYFEGFGAGATACRKPILGDQDADHSPDASDPYVTWSNPLIYFNSIADAPDCANNVTDLASLESDLGGVGTPAFSLIVPNRCHSGSDVACVEGAPAGLTSSDDFLRTTVDKILASEPYKEGGLIAITFDQSPQDVAAPDTSFCCDQPTFVQPLPKAPAESPPTGETGATGETSPTGPVDPTPPIGLLAAPPIERPAPSQAAGGKVGLLLLSPYVEPGTRNETDSYNHFGLLSTIAGFFGAEKVGHAALATPLNETVFNKTVEPVATASRN